jgi:hypothetical protein
MKILTINPVTINGKHISNPSKYLNANGGDDDYYGFDASGKPTTKAEVKQFQTYLVSKGVDISYTTKAGKTFSGANAIDGDMRAGSKTAKAWDTNGADFVKSLSTGTTPTGTTPTGTTPTGTTPTGTTPTGTTPTGTTPTAEPTKDEQIANAKLGKIWDKTKGWITSDKAKDVLRSLTEGGGFMGVLNALLGGGSGGDGSTGGSTGGSTDGGTTPPPTGLSKGAKIGIAIGVVAVVGIIIYVATRPKTTK